MLQLNLSFILLFLNIISCIFAASIYCFHGDFENEWQDNELSRMWCPSGKCITFFSKCETYWATTCYDETKPMTIINAFQKAKKYYKTLPRNNPNFEFCTTSYCNDIPTHENSTAIFKTPESFDNLLWPALGKRLPRNILQNSVAITPLIENEIVEFRAQTYVETKKIWIEFESLTKNQSYILQRFDFNFKDGTYSQKISHLGGKKEDSLPNDVILGTEKRLWRTAFKPGEIFVASVKNKLTGYEISFNSLTRSFHFPSLQKLNLITYGGKMRMLNGTASYKNLNSNTFLKFTKLNSSLTFDHPKPIPFTCDEKYVSHFQLKTSLQYSYIGDKFHSEKPYILGSNVTLKAYDFIEYELRESLCPNSNLIKFQVQIFPDDDSFNATVHYNVRVWQRYNSVWQKEQMPFENIEFIGGCKDYNFGVYIGNIHFHCGVTLPRLNYYNQQFLQRSPITKYDSFQFNINYFVEGIKQENKCRQ